MKEIVERIVTLVPASVHRRFKVACAKAGLSMAALLRELTEDWLRKYEGKEEDNNAQR